MSPDAAGDRHTPGAGPDPDPHQAHERGRSGAAPLFAILTLFPEALDAYLGIGVVGLARARRVFDVELVDFRDFARDRHRTVDDRPFGGGPGMVLRPEPIVECVEWLEARAARPWRKLLMCPGGRRFDQAFARELAAEPQVLLLCGRYEGVDARVAELCGFEPVSLGDYVLAGGELAALSVLEATVRLLPGALGDERSAVEESFRADAPDGAAGGEGLLDHPHFTRPRVYRGRAVPEVLTTGDHARIARWRERMALERTRDRRPDLLGDERGAPPDPERETTNTGREAARRAGAPGPAAGRDPGADSKGNDGERAAQWRGRQR